MSLKSPVTPPGIDPGIVRLVAQRLNHYATPGPYIWDTCDKLLCMSSYLMSAFTVGNMVKPSYFKSCIYIVNKCMYNSI